jgi:hypothetical protein
MSEHKKRFNYLSHLIDASVDGVVRLAKTSATISCFVLLIVGINTMAFWRISATFSQAALFMLAGWLALFSIIFMVQTSWVAYMVHADVEQILSEYNQVEPPLPQETVTRVYKPHSTGYTLESEETKWGGVGKSKIDNS